MQYLHQLDLLNLLPALVGSVTVPPAVVEELSEGQRLGINLPNPLSLSWIIVRSPVSAPALWLISDLGPGESEVLALALETPNSVVILRKIWGQSLTVCCPNPVLITTLRLKFFQRRSAEIAG